jgi:hypothetical protein
LEIREIFKNSLPLPPRPTATMVKEPETNPFIAKKTLPRDAAPKAKPYEMRNTPAKTQKAIENDEQSNASAPKTKESAKNKVTPANATTANTTTDTTVTDERSDAEEPQLRNTNTAAAEANTADNEKALMQSTIPSYIALITKLAKTLETMNPTEESNQTTIEECMTILSTLLQAIKNHETPRTADNVDNHNNSCCITDTTDSK